MTSALGADRVTRGGTLFELIASLAFVVSTVGSGPRGLAGYTFESYMRDFEKLYSPASELLRRRAVFELNLAKIITHNAEYEMGSHSWWMDVNQLTDWTADEFQGLRSAHMALHLMWGSGGPLRIDAVGSTSQNVSNPNRVDWREKNVVTPPYDQGSCGSCWAFAAAEALESHYAIASGKLLPLAAQALVSCVSNPEKCGGRGGCGGATVELALNYTLAKGLPLESEMPYLRRDAMCKAYSAAVGNEGYVKLPSNDASALETAVASIGPVSVLAAALPWQLYGGGIFRGCSQPLPSLGNELDHAVQVVGYGAEGGQRYWLVRNSWGQTWGEDGYIRITRDNDGKTFVDDSPSDGDACKPYPKSQTVGGECGILFDATYPTGVSAKAFQLLV